MACKDNTLSTNETYDDRDNYISHQLPAEECVPRIYSCTTLEPFMSLVS